MKRCERCGKIIWTWKESFYFQFSDIEKKQLCSGCFCGLVEFTQKILATQRDFFLKGVLQHDICANGCSLEDCEKLKIDCSTPRDAICTKCWCEAANKEMESE